MKNLIIISVILSTFILVGCSDKVVTPTSVTNTPSSHSDTKTAPSMSMKHSSSDASTSTHMDPNEHHVASEEGFIAEMIPHHQEAVDAAKIIVEKTKNQKLKTVAQAIIDAQNTEIAQLKGWMQAWYPTSTMQPAYMLMMRDLTKLSGHDLDDAFMEDMIKHHQSAIHMAEDVLELSQKPEIVTLAKNIISS